MMHNEAVEVANALWKLNTYNSSTLLNLAAKMNYGPFSKPFRRLVGSAYKYELVTGSWAKDVNTLISISQLGQSIVGKTREDDPHASKIEAFLKPKIFANFIESVKSGSLPSDEECENALIRNFNFSKESAKKCYSVIRTNLTELELIMETGGQQFIQMDSSTPISNQAEEESVESQPTTDEEIIPSKSESKPIPSNNKQTTPQIFIAHGKGKKPLEQLKRILDDLGIDCKIAVREPNEGQAVNEKIIKLMKGSACGIFIFTADKQVVGEGDNQVWRTSQNVAYELGVALALYEKRIVIFKEDKVVLPSNFSHLAYISFEQDKLNAKILDFWRECKNLGFKLVYDP